MKKYYIYHIPTFVHKDGRIGKIGCTVQEVNKRSKKQGYTEYEILETHECIYKASDREIELQKEYCYPVDKIPYYKIVKIPTQEGRLKGGESAVKSGQFKLFCSKGGKVGGKILFETKKGIFSLSKEQKKEISKMGVLKQKIEDKIKGGKASGNLKITKTFTCTYCNKTGKFLGMIRWHGENCKHKPTL
jgi:hypothetical protein